MECVDTSIVLAMEGLVLQSEIYSGAIEISSPIILLNVLQTNLFCLQAEIELASYTHQEKKEHFRLARMSQGMCIKFILQVSREAVEMQLCNKKLIIISFCAKFLDNDLEALFFFYDGIIYMYYLAIYSSACFGGIIIIITRFPRNTASSRRHSIFFLAESAPLKRM